MTTIAVTCVHGSNTEVVKEIVVGVPIRFGRIKLLESTLRSAIDNADNQFATVVQDLYRWLVISNFATLNWKKGETARQELEELYPDRGSLPNFVVVSQHFNTGGANFHNIHAHPNGENGYSLLPSILLELLQAGLPRVVCERQT